MSPLFYQSQGFFIKFQASVQIEDIEISMGKFKCHGIPSLLFFPAFTYVDPAFGMGVGF